MKNLIRTILAGLGAKKLVVVNVDVLEPFLFFFCYIGYLVLYSMSSKSIDPEIK
ncbi:hypothetical protein KIM67_17795 [Flagellimonas sp. 389]|uniref:hypothetical protein n=1 Tax=Flagellimonas sp. 389 TaxID=2835862 RepID=UPI001BD30D17|nr:hypothetical protein [Flagellimonas sp. 389]MBS9464281.1 hypothetical protein [Flagellimonas sp. 389]